MMCHVANALGAYPVLESIKQQLGDSIRIIKVEVDKYQQTAAQYRVQSVPILMLFRSGQNLWRQSGAMSASSVLSIIKQ